MNEKALKKLRDIEMGILDVFVDICGKNNLAYYIIGGTLLGAVRHKGFIPWDDDLDVCMPRKDFDQFVEIYASELPKEYYIQWITTDKTYWYPFARIRKRNTLFAEERTAHVSTELGICIDIFPLDNAKKQRSLFQAFQKKMLRQHYNAIFVKHCIKFSTKPKGGIFLSKLPIPLSVLVKRRNAIMKWNKNSNSKYYANLGSRYDYIKQTIPKEVYGSGTPLEFEGKYYNAPSDWNYVLARVYGADYMELPPIEKRISHSLVKLSFDLENGEYEEV